MRRFTIDGYQVYTHELRDFAAYQREFGAALTLVQGHAETYGCSISGLDEGPLGGIATEIMQNVRAQLTGVFTVLAASADVDATKLDQAADIYEGIDSKQADEFGSTLD